MIQAHQLTKRYGDKTAVHTLSFTIAPGIFALIIFHLVLGWKVYSLSRNPAGILEDRGNTGNGVRAEGDFDSTEPINVAQQGRETP